MMDDIHGRPIGERMAIMEERMRGYDDLERSTVRIIRQMDRVVLLGTQALEEIGELKLGLRRVETDLRAHISRPVVQIIRERWPELAPLIGTALLILYVNRETVERLGLWLIGASPA